MKTEILAEDHVTSKLLFRRERYKWSDGTTKDWITIRFEGHQVNVNPTTFLALADRLCPGGHPAEFKIMADEYNEFVEKKGHPPHDEPLSIEIY